MTSQNDSRAEVLTFAKSPLTWNALPICLNFSWSCDYKEKHTRSLIARRTQVIPSLLINMFWLSSLSAVSFTQRYIRPAWAQPGLFPQCLVSQGNAVGMNTFHERTWHIANMDSFLIFVRQRFATAGSVLFHNFNNDLWALGFFQKVYLQRERTVTSKWANSCEQN